MTAVMRRAVLIALFSASLAGCGGSSRASGPSGSSGSSGGKLSAFRAGFAQDRVQFSRLGADIGTAVSTASRRSNAALSTEFGALAARARAQRARLARLKPPARYAARLRVAVSALGHVAEDLRAIAAAAATGNNRAAHDSAAQLVRDSLAFQSSERSLSQSLGLPARA